MGGQMTVGETTLLRLVCCRHPVGEWFDPVAEVGHGDPRTIFMFRRVGGSEVVRTCESMAADGLLERLGEGYAVTEAGYKAYLRIMRDAAARAPRFSKRRPDGQDG